MCSCSDLLQAGGRNLGGVGDTLHYNRLHHSLEPRPLEDLDVLAYRQRRWLVVRRDARVQATDVLLPADRAWPEPLEVTAEAVLLRSLGLAAVEERGEAEDVHAGDEKVASCPGNTRHDAFHACGRDVARRRDDARKDCTVVVAAQLDDKLDESAASLAFGRRPLFDHPVERPQEAHMAAVNGQDRVRPRRGRRGRR
jgi:hypothetical protein